MNPLRFVKPVTSKFVPSTTPRIVRFYSAPAMSYEHILVSNPKPGVGLVTLNRPRALNALSTPLFLELNDALLKLNQDKDTGAIVITGSNKAFAAGADIKEMKDLTFSSAYTTDFIELWSSPTSQIKKPIIAAVNGYALGGGCELAMMTDIIYCSSTATFGQPEIKLGTIPGAGGSQRLTRAIGKSRAMELILTGKNFSGKEAGEWGLAARVFQEPEECLEEALKTAELIAGYSQVAVKAAKEVVNKSQDLGVRDGMEYERRVFHSLFGSKDQKIGMFYPASIPVPLLTKDRHDGIRGEEKAGVVELVKYSFSLVSKHVMYRHKYSHGAVLGHSQRQWENIEVEGFNEMTGSIPSGARAIRLGRRWNHLPGAGLDKGVWVIKEQKMVLYGSLTLSPTPSVYQVRYRGYKGVVILDPAMRGETLTEFRKSTKPSWGGGDDCSFTDISLLFVLTIHGAFHDPDIIFTLV
ncbi:hypothetical protein FGG08_007447 [Glutinoglossum americanum]|uniref:Enoyl-CoA hydratase n=1 Tax=Glutinoglossum americanum TaxID=1670608 RepID=A0A9P8KTX0_9PEZI|nr:hypothetical protein FGG08_007447 [Glutinoglossum americanum]